MPLTVQCNVIEWINKQTIHPLHWGCSTSKLVEAFPKSDDAIKYAHKTKTPFISLDFVDFYFDDELHHNGLNTVIIQCSSIYKGMRSEFFDMGWLRNDVSFEQVEKRLQNQGIEYRLSYQTDECTPR
jgi:hypothetical protein